MAGEKDKKPKVDLAVQQAMLIETIQKEERYQKLFTNYSINPFRKMHRLTDKPNSMSDAAEGEEDSYFRAVIARANEVPTHKFVCPQTAAQEHGWITQPLTDVDRTDSRFYFPKRSSDVTSYKEKALKS